MKNFGGLEHKSNDKKWQMLTALLSTEDKL